LLCYQRKTCRCPVADVLPLHRELRMHEFKTCTITVSQFDETAPY
jgi:hypothetical protein